MTESELLETDSKLFADLSGVFTFSRGFVGRVEDRDPVRGRAGADHLLTRRSRD